MLIEEFFSLALVFLIIDQVFIRRSFKNCNRFSSSSESEGKDGLGWGCPGVRVVGRFGEGAREERFRRLRSDFTGRWRLVIIQFS